MTTSSPASDVTVYWRPGCGFCASLLYRLDRSDIAFARVNIWENPQAAAFVRSVARGNETVPTVTVGESALVNPTFAELQAAVNGTAPAGRRLFRR